MFGLHRAFSVDVVGGRSLVLHGSTEGSMLGTGRRDAGRFLHFNMVTPDPVWRFLDFFNVTLASSEFQDPISPDGG